MIQVYYTNRDIRERRQLHIPTETFYTLHERIRIWTMSLSFGIMKQCSL